MEVIRNIRILGELDDETAVTVIQLALEELNQLLENDQGIVQAAESTNSEARRKLERQRDELQRNLRRR
jgi:hypothetical protein